MISKLCNVLFVALLLTAFQSHAQIRISTYAGVQSTGDYAGDDGPAQEALLFSPSGVALDKTGNLYIADFVNNRVRKVDTFGIITTIAGTGLGAGGTATGSFSGDGGPATAADLNGPFAVVVDKAGNVIFADGYNHVVRKVNTAGIITTIAGTHIAAGYTGDGGPATDARLNNPVGLALDTAGNLYIADDHNSVIRKVTPAGIISTFAGNGTADYGGNGGPATAAQLNMPLDVAIDSRNNVYIADAQNNTIRKVDTGGIITSYAGGIDTVHGYSGDAGPAISARLYNPTRITFDNADNLYISDALNNVVRKVTPEGSIYAFAATGVQGYSGDGGTPDTAEMALPHGVAIDQHGVVYIADRANNVVRRIGPPLVLPNPESVYTQAGMHAGMNIYPNPVRTGLLNVNITAALTEEAAITITNVLGQTISRQTIMTNKPATIKMAVPAGIYFISAVTRHGNWKAEVVAE